MRCVEEPNGGREEHPSSHAENNRESYGPFPEDELFDHYSDRSDVAMPSANSPSTPTAVPPAAPTVVTPSCSQPNKKKKLTVAENQNQTHSQTQNQTKPLIKRGRFSDYERKLLNTAHRSLLSNNKPGRRNALAKQLATKLNRSCGAIIEQLRSRDKLMQLSRAKPLNTGHPVPPVSADPAQSAPAWQDTVTVCDSSGGGSEDGEPLQTQMDWDQCPLNDID